MMTPAPQEVENEVVVATEQKDANAPIKIEVSYEKTEYFELKQNSSLSQLQSAFARTIRMDVNHLRFVHRGRRVREDDTPAGLGMKNKDTITVFVGSFAPFKFGLEIFSYRELAKRPEDRAAIRTTCSIFVGAPFNIFEERLLREIDSALKPPSLSFADYHITYTTDCQPFQTPTVLRTEKDYNYFMYLGQDAMVSVVQEKRPLGSRGLKRTKDADEVEPIDERNKKKKKATEDVMPENEEPLIPAGLQPGPDMSISDFCKTYMLNSEICALFTEGGYSTTASFEYTNIPHLFKSGFLYGHVAEVRAAVAMWAEQKDA